MFAEYVYIHSVTNPMLCYNWQCFPKVAAHYWTYDVQGVKWTDVELNVHGP